MAANADTDRMHFPDGNSQRFFWSIEIRFAPGTASRKTSLVGQRHARTGHVHGHHSWHRRGRLYGDAFPPQSKLFGTDIDGAGSCGVGYKPGNNARPPGKPIEKISGKLSRRIV